MTNNTGYKKSTEVKKICGICGDKAIGYNFNAITCESCKAFFRRNAMNNKKFNCPFNGNCSIDLNTRRFCQKCRLNKCFDIGMKKEWILSEEEKQIKRIKIETNRQKKQKIKDNERDCDSTTCLTTNQHNYNSQHSIVENLSNTNSLNSIPDHYPNHYNLNNMDKIDSNIIETNDMLDTVLDMNLTYRVNSIKNNFKKRIKNFFNSQSNEYSLINNKELNKISVKSEIVNTGINSQEYDNTVITQDMANINNQINQRLDCNKRDIESKIGKNHFQTSEIPVKVSEKSVETKFANTLFRKSVNIIGLSELENEKLSELSNATIIMTDPVLSVTSVTTGIVDALTLVDLGVRRFIKMAKKLRAFESLCESDQITLLRIGCPEMMFVRSVVSFDFDSESWTIAKDENNATLIKLDILKQTKVNIYDGHKQFMISFKQEWNHDEYILDLCTAILLFSPNRSNLINKQVVKLEQQTYMYLLQRYLEVKYSSKCEGKNRFLKLMNNLEYLYRFSEAQIQDYLDIDHEQVGPLVIEIFNFKDKN